MKTKLLAGLLVAGSSLFAAPRIGFGIGIGVPIAPVVVAPAYVAPAYVPPAPGPDYAWVAGYYVGPVWHPGYWRRPLVVGPRVGFYGGFRGRRF
ncbi:MAG: hypothetical protein ABSB35_31655 [Bryobacteraceae bacterium]|jgi:hypothetical protein